MRLKFELSSVTISFGFRKGLWAVFLPEGYLYSYRYFVYAGKKHDISFLSLRECSTWFFSRRFAKIVREGYHARNHDFLLAAIASRCTVRPCKLCEIIIIRISWQYRVNKKKQRVNQIPFLRGERKEKFLSWSHRMTSSIVSCCKIS